MASQREQQHLKKVGLEGFALIDECYGRTRRSNSNHQSQRLHQLPQPKVHQSHYQYFYYQHQQAYVCQAPQVYTVTKEPAFNNYHAGTTSSQHQYYEGTQVSVAKEAVYSSNEAAKFYGGTMAVDYTSKNKPLHRAYY